MKSCVIRLLFIHGASQDDGGSIRICPGGWGGWGLGGGSVASSARLMKNSGVLRIMLLSCRQGRSPADAGCATLSLRSVLVLGAAGGFGLVGGATWEESSGVGGGEETEGWC